MIDQIQIQNFRSIRDVTVGLEPVTVFVGKSGSGKTNFVSAVRFLRDYLKLGHQVFSQGYPYEVCRCLTNPGGPIQFQVRFRLPGFRDQFDYLLKLEQQRIIAESLQYGIKTVFAQVLNNVQQVVWTTPPALVPTPNPGPLALGRLPGHRRGGSGSYGVEHLDRRLLVSAPYPFRSRRKSTTRGGGGNGRRRRELPQRHG